MCVCVCVCVCVCLCVWLVLCIRWLLTTGRFLFLISLGQKQVSIFSFFSFDRLFYLPTPSNIWILASGAARSTEQAWLWLSELGDLLRRLIALCCVWDSVALRGPTKITTLYPLPRTPPPPFAFNPATGSSRENCPPTSSLLRLRLSQSEGQ